MLKVTAIGNLGADPEMRYTEEGVEVTSFRLACRDGKDKDGEERTVWVSVTAWRKLGELANEYLVKGSKVAVLGRLSVHQYKRNDDTMAVDIKVTADDLEFLSPSPKAEAATTAP